MNTYDTWLLEMMDRLIYQSVLYENDLWWFVGFIAGLTLLLIWIIEERPILQVPLWFIFLATVCFQPLLFLIVPAWSENHWVEPYAIPIEHLYAYGGGMLIIFVPGLILLRSAFGTIDGWLYRFTRKTSLERDSNSDIRYIDKLLPKELKTYKVERYFKKRHKIFIGLNRQKRPIYISTEKWRSSHMDIIGTTGSGKGVAAGYLLTQASMQGEAVVIIDPKDDEFLPHVMAQAAQKAGVPYYCIDLTGGTPQWNPIASKSNFELEELLAGAFSLTDKGSDADFYRLNDRKAAKAFSSLICQDEASMAHRAAEFIRCHSEISQDAKKFVSDLEELTSLPVVNTSDGLNISQALAEGAVIYVKGSIRHPGVLKLQKMFVLSVMQHCQSRDRDSARHVCIFLDEFKYLISNPSLQALGAIRDKRAHVILAHQSIGDLRDCPKDIDPDSVIASVNENCSLKLTYKINAPDTAEWLARMSGKILVDDELRTFSTSRVFAEVRERERTLRQSERYLIDTNMLQSLPNRCAVLFGNGLADYVFTSPVSVTKEAENTRATSFGLSTPETMHDTKSLGEELLDVD